MRSSGLLSLALTTLVGVTMVSAASPHGKFDRRSHKAIIADRQAKEATVNGVPEGIINKRTGKTSRKYKKRGGKICKVKDAAAVAASSSASSAAASSMSSSASAASASQSASSTVTEASSTAAVTPTVVAAVLEPPSTTLAASTSGGAWGGEWNEPASSSSAAWSSSSWVAPTSTSTSSSVVEPTATQAPPSNSGLLYASGPCGDSQPSADHPNGALWWLNCGLNDNGWNPPSIRAKDLIAITDPSTHPEVFGACLQYQDIFADAAAKQQMPTALLMSIGMQESGCKRGAVGARGEQGIMQVAGNACDNPSGDCKEPWYNIHKGAQILVDKMGGNPDGNIISALGQYNGWMPGMKCGHGAEYGPEGQKVSYLDDMLNKWMQGKRTW